jgi:hypothetical protein
MDELPPHAKDLLSLARMADEPPTAARERVRHAVAVALTAGAATAVGTAASHAAASGVTSMGAKAGWLASTAVKLVITGGVLAALGTTALIMQPTRHAAREAAPATRAAVQSPSRTATQTARASVPSQPVAAVPVVPVFEPSQAVPPLAPVQPLLHAVAGHAHRAPAVATAVTAVAPEPSLHAEMTILYEASAALDRGQLAQARSLLASHRTQYANGQLSEERRGLEVLTACMDHRPAANSSARVYLRDKPDALLASRIALACKLESAP